MDGEEARRENTSCSSQPYNNPPCTAGGNNNRAHLEPAGPVVFSAQSFLQTTNVFVANTGEKGHTH